jgi:ABC-type multidrug transport system ATPase subunit
VLATHELDEAERLADRVIIFDQGEIIADGTLDELRRGHDEIRFRSAPDLDVVDLGGAMHLPVTALGDGQYLIAAATDPQIVSQLTGWLSRHGHPLTDLRAGAQRLEDVFRRLTTAASDSDGDGDGARS